MSATITHLQAAQIFYRGADAHADICPTSVALAWDADGIEDTKRGPSVTLVGRR